MTKAILALATALAASPAAGEVRVSSFHSESLGRDVAVAVQLPPSYAASQRRFPVVYALHGLFEDQGFWERRGLAAFVYGLWASKEVPEFLVVAMDGGNSFFVNGKSGRFEDLVTRDTVSYVESTYRVTPGRDARALLGVSMGGYAALRIALAHPEVFVAVASHSAMLLETIPTPELGARGWHMAAFHSAFGDPIDPALWASTDPLALAERVDPRRAPALYFDCGAQDRYGLFAGNEDLHRRLSARGVAHEFHLSPGDHGYDFVRSVIGQSLSFLGRALGKPSPRGVGGP